MTKATKVTIRRATRDDADAIYFVLQACDREIPVNLDDDDFRRHIQDKIRVACLGGQTRVAVSGNQVIGFLLALPVSSEGWFELSYVGVLQNYRGNHLFPKMLGEIKEVASGGLYGDVNDKNQCGMADRLLKAGFVESPKDAISSRDRAFRWSPALPHEN